MFFERKKKFLWQMEGRWDGSWLLNFATMYEVLEILRWILITDQFRIKWHLLSEMISISNGITLSQKQYFLWDYFLKGWRATDWVWWTRVTSHSGINFLSSKVNAEFFSSYTVLVDFHCQFGTTQSHLRRGNLSWITFFISLAPDHVCEGWFWFMNNVGGPSPLWVAPFHRQMGLSCLGKLP